jgi:uncharacterized membrane protein YgdD (TMEM256/DUF423 family)
MSRVRSDVLAAVSGALLLAVGIGVGALGAHVLKVRLGPEHYATLQTAVQYQLVDALGLLALGAWLRAGVAARTRRGEAGSDTTGDAALRLPVWLVIIGTVLFSGSLYGLLAGAPRFTGVLTPLGGSSLILGWALAARAFWRGRNVPGS